MIELTKFAAKTQIGDSPDTVTINKNGVLKFSILACERAGIDGNTYLNCFFDKNDKDNMYLLSSTYDVKKSAEGYRASKTNKITGGESGIIFSITAFLKRMGYDSAFTNVFEFEVIQISGTDYIRINISKAQKVKEEENGG